MSNYMLQLLSQLWHNFLAYCCQDCTRHAPATQKRKTRQNLNLFDYRSRDIFIVRPNFDTNAKCHNHFLLAV